MNFISEKFEKAITSYINYINNGQRPSVFCYDVNVINTLVLIYGSSEIIQPFQTKNETEFKKNIMKYGITEDEYNSFITNFNNIPTEAVRSNIYPDIQKILFSMIQKRNQQQKFTEEEIKNINNTLYISSNENINYSSFVQRYFESFVDEDYNLGLKRQPNKVYLSSDRVSYLPDNAYINQGFNPESVRNLDDDQLSLFNEQIKREEQKNSDDVDGGIGRVLSKLPPAVRNGSGFVDALLLTGTIAILVLIIFVVYLIFR